MRYRLALIVIVQCLFVVAFMSRGTADETADTRESVQRTEAEKNFVLDQMREDVPRRPVATGCAHAIPGRTTQGRRRAPRPASSPFELLADQRLSSVCLSSMRLPAVDGLVEAGTSPR